MRTACVPGSTLRRTAPHTAYPYHCGSHALRTDAPSTSKAKRNLTRCRTDIPTVSLDAISLVASSCGYYRGQIARRAAQYCTAHLAAQRGRATRLPHRQPPRVQPVAPMRERNCRRPRRPPRRCTAQAPSRAQGHPGGAYRSRNDPHRLPMPRDALPTRLSSFRLLVMASPHLALVGSH